MNVYCLSLVLFLGTFFGNHLMRSWCHCWCCCCLFMRYFSFALRFIECALDVLFSRECTFGACKTINIRNEQTKNGIFHLQNKPANENVEKKPDQANRKLITTWFFLFKWKEKHLFVSWWWINTQKLGTKTEEKLCKCKNTNKTRRLNVIHKKCNLLNLNESLISIYVYK